jgi:hypothetical protein
MLMALLDAYLIESSDNVKFGKLFRLEELA